MDQTKPTTDTSRGWTTSVCGPTTIRWHGLWRVKRLQEAPNFRCPVSRAQPLREQFLNEAQDARQQLLAKIQGLQKLTQVKIRLTPSTQSKLCPKLICFFYVETHKVSTSIRGGFHILLHKTFLEHVHSARLSCTADTRPLNEFEKCPNLAENRVGYFLLTTWDSKMEIPSFSQRTGLRPDRKSCR